MKDTNDHYIIQKRSADKTRWFRVSDEISTLTEAFKTMKKMEEEEFPGEKFRVAVAYTVIKYRPI